MALFLLSLNHTAQTQWMFGGRGERLVNVRLVWVEIIRQVSVNRLCEGIFWCKCGKNVLVDVVVMKGVY